MLPNAVAIFQEAEQCFKGPEWIEIETAVQDALFS